MDLLRHLRFFVAVAEQRHFGNAAATLAMAQPPLSQGIQRLERHLEQRLFDRDARRVVLTPAGTALLPTAREILQIADGFVDTARGWTDQLVVRVGLASDLDALAGHVLAQFTHDGIQLAPHLAGSNELIGQVRDGGLDLAVVRHPSPVDGLLAGDVVTLPGGLDVDALARGLPVVLPPRQHHPAAHDQLVDTLRRLGYDNSVLEIPLHQERQAWITARMGTGIALAGGDALTSPTSEDHVPLRFRVIAPVIGDQRAGVHYEPLAERLETAMR